MAEKTEQASMAHEDKMILTIIFLCIPPTYLLGVIFMWLWMKSWKLWLKILLTLPLVLIPLFIFMLLGFLLVAGRIMHDDMRPARFNHRYQYQYDMPTPMQATMGATMSATPASVRR